jgi:hypothetical protein
MPRCASYNARMHDSKLAAWLDEEFVPLERAAILAYYRVNDSRDPGGPEEFRDEFVPLLGAALSTVAPIYLTTGDGTAAQALSEAQLDQRLIRPLRIGGMVRPELQGLHIMRRDLQRAIGALRQARVSFDHR